MLCTGHKFVECINCEGGGGGGGGDTKLIHSLSTRALVTLPVPYKLSCQHIGQSTSTDYAPPLASQITVRYQVASGAFLQFVKRLENGAGAFFPGTSLQRLEVLRAGNLVGHHRHVVVQKVLVQLCTDRADGFQQRVCVLRQLV